GRNHGADRLRGQRGAAADRAANFEGLRRQPGGYGGIFYVGIFGNVGGAGNPSGSRAARHRDQLGDRAGGPQLHGAVQPGGGTGQFSRRKNRRGRRRLLHLAKRDAHDQFLPPSANPRDQSQQGGGDRQRAGARSRRLYRFDGGRPGDPRDRDVYRRRARRAALLRQRPARGRASSGGHLEGRGDRG